MKMDEMSDEERVVVNRVAWSGVGGVVTIVMATLAATSPLWPLWAAFAVVGFYFTLAPLLHLWPWQHFDQGERKSLLLSLNLPCRELNTLHGIVQSDASAGYSVPQRRKELTEINGSVQRLLGRSPLLRMYESDAPPPKQPLVGQLMDHDESLFEAELQHRLNMLVEVTARLVKEGT